jgi:predicted ATPase
LPALARALGVAGVGVDDSLDRLADVLGEQHRLVVLDNCEHLLGAAPDISALLARVPTLTVLATSRAPLHIAGEHRVPIPPLSLPPRSAAQDPTQLAHSEAVALFQDRAQASDPAFELTPTNAAHIAAICRHLDGLPLAIELAAARSTVLALAELRERLTRRLPLLTSGSRDAPMRHQTLRAAIDWSYRLVPASGQRLFRRLAVFAGGWTLEAAGAVCGSAGDASVLDDLQVLLEHCLITALPELDGRRRYTMLETVREYAFERLAEAAETAQTRDAHARYFLELVNRVAPQVKGPESARGLARLEQEHANLRAALGWAIEQRQVAPVAEGALTLWIFWWNCGHLAEGQRWLERLAAASDHDVVARTRARVRHGSCVAARRPRNGRGASGGVPAGPRTGR